MVLGYFNIIMNGLKKTYKLFKLDINPIAVCGLYLGFIRFHTFDLKHIGKIKLNKSKLGYLHAYQLLHDLNIDSETIKSIIKAQKNNIIEFHGIKFIINHPFTLNVINEVFNGEYMMENMGGGR
ncbi:MAG: hypothetical protein LBB45_00550 [Methanobrevibacter sp.]|jgi:hypothetical protein|nr:hypothetical protein [Candidatus Methanovirga basalitermitum]